MVFYCTQFLVETLIQMSNSLFLVKREKGGSPMVCQLSYKKKQKSHSCLIKELYKFQLQRCRVKPPQRHQKQLNNSPCLSTGAEDKSTKSESMVWPRHQLAHLYVPFSETLESLADNQLRIKLHDNNKQTILEAPQLPHSYPLFEHIHKSKFPFSFNLLLRFELVSDSFGFGRCYYI